MSSKLTRRDFIIRSAAGVIAGGALISANKLEAFSKSKQTSKTSFIKSGDDIIIKLSDSPSLSKTGGNVRVNDEIILIRKSDSEFIAIKTICTHKGCDVELEGSKFVCPCHGSEYTIDGTVTQGPAKKDLKKYETIFDSENGTVTIKDGAKQQ
jgi:cytochrome b6-f complex iron-sulfur subunit